MDLAEWLAIKELKREQWTQLPVEAAKPIVLALSNNDAHPQVISLDQSTAEPVLLHRPIESSNSCQS